MLECFQHVTPMTYQEDFMAEYLYLPHIFPIKCVGGLSAFMRAWLHRYENQKSATYIILLRAYEVVDVNG